MVQNDEVVSAQAHSYRLLTTGSLRQAGMLRGRIFMDKSSFASGVQHNNKPQNR